MRRLTIHMHKGNPHVLDFENDEGAAAALKEVHAALTLHGAGRENPVTIADRVVVRPIEVRSAELGDPPGAAFA